MTSITGRDPVPDFQEIGSSWTIALSLKDTFKASYYVSFAQDTFPSSYFSPEVRIEVPYWMFGQLIKVPIIPMNLEPGDENHDKLWHGTKVEELEYPEIYESYSLARFEATKRIQIRREYDDKYTIDDVHVFYQYLRIVQRLPEIEGNVIVPDIPEIDRIAAALRSVKGNSRLLKSSGLSEEDVTDALRLSKAVWVRLVQGGFDRIKRQNLGECGGRYELLKALYELVLVGWTGWQWS